MDCWSRENKMTRTKNNKVLVALIALAWPSILEGLLQTILQYVDTAMVGRLGAEATATVSLSSTFSWTINSVIGALGVGFLSYISRAIGEQNEEKIRGAASQTILVTLVLGFSFMLLTIWMAPHMPVWMGADTSIHADASRYFLYINLPMVFRAATIIFGASIRATGDTRTPMYVNVIVNVINIGLNYVFIYALGYGAIGAGIATGISVVIGGIWMSISFWENKRVGGVLSVKPNRKILGSILAIGIPVVLTRLASCMGHVIFTSFVSSMATTIYAAHAIAITAEEIFYIPGYGMMSATSTLIGNAVGERNKKKERDVKVYSIGIIFVLMCVSGVLLFFGAEFMMRLFTTDAEVIRIGTKLLRMVAFTEPVFGTSAVMEGIYNGMGRTKFPLAVELISMWGVRILGTFLCIHVFHLGITSVWVMMICNNILKAVLLAAGIFFLHRS